MKGLKGSKLVLVLTLVVMVVATFAVSVVSSVMRANAAVSDTPAVTTALPPAWFQLAPTGSVPSPRANAGHVVAYDQTNDRLIIFGGDDMNGTLLNETWVLVGADGTVAGPHWIQLNTVNTPAPRKGHSGVYDAAHNILIIYGGCLGLCTPIDTNVYTLSNANGLGGTPTWTQLSTAGGPPPQRDGASAVYDPTTNELIIFGGDNCCGSRYNDTWILSNANGLGTGTPTWTQLSTTGTPPARVGNSAVYDVTNNRLIIFGGADCCGNVLNDTWVLSNANGTGGTPTWTQLSPKGTLPPVRADHGAAYDAAANKMIIFAGSNTTVQLNDTWTLGHANGLGGTPAWSQAVPVSTSPSPRTQCNVVYNTSTHRLVIFGGANSSSYFNETWVLMNIK